MKMIHINQIEDKCPCEWDGDIDVVLDARDYTSLEIIKDRYAVTLAAYGDGEASWETKYCPLCGRRINRELT